MNGLLQSRKFWIAIVTTVVDITLVVIGQFAPEWKEFTLALIGPISGLAAVVIGGIALEDAGAKFGGA
jgi:hypothetical protein